MTELDEEFGPLASELIGEYGKQIMFGRVIPGAYDKATGRAIPTDDTRPVKALIEAVTFRQAKGIIQVGDLTLTMAASDLPGGVSPEDVAIIDGVAYKVVASSSTFSGEQAAIHTVTVRK